MRKFFDRFLQRDGFNPFEIEDSWVFRLLVFLTVTVAIFSTCQVAESSLYVPVTAVVATGVGAWISFKRRLAKNWWIKLILALLMLLALANFMVDISDNPYDARIPLAYLLIWLQVLHSYDLPKRKDLFYSLWVALILISVAGTISRDFSFGIYLVGFVGLGTLSLFYSHLSSQKVLKLPPAFGAKLMLPTLIISLCATFLAFMFLPRYESKMQAMPMSLKMQSLPFFSGEIRNPAYPSRAGEVGSGQPEQQTGQKRKFDPYAYYGFSTQLDLNYRGRLSDEVVMRVRSAKPNYWRGMAFDKYTGQRWEMTLPYKLRRVGAGRVPLYVRETVDLKYNIVSRDQVVQTFYIERDQSNLIFKASYAEFLYFPADYVLVDVYGGLRSPVELLHGTTYSVVSEIPRFEPKKLSMVSMDLIRQKPADAMYYQLPPNLPQRVKDLAKTVTEKATSPYQAVKMLENYLKTTFPYDLDVPEFPENRDAVDYFLFQQKAGYCEHFASSLAIMARSLGLPTRMVTGYVPGTYNPVTGYFDVRSRDAHGWVEVYFPHHGWVPFDPTPGYLANLNEPSVYQDNTGFQFAKFFMNLLPEPVKKFFEQVFGWVLVALSNFFGLLARVLQIVSPQQLALLIGVTIMGVLAFVGIRSRRQRLGGEAEILLVPAYTQIPSKKQLVQLYLQVLGEAETVLGLQAEAADTPRERMAVLASHPDGVALDELQALTDFYYQTRYSSAELTEVEAQQLMQRLKQVRQQLKQIKRETVQSRL